jgi:hypothetical protein
MSVTLAIAAAATVGSAISGYATNNANARSAAAWADYNSKMRKIEAQQAAEQTMAIAGINAGLLKMGAEMEAAAMSQIANFNAALKKQVATYDSLLLEGEVTKIWNAFGLDKEEAKKAKEAAKGEARVYYAAADVDPNEGTPLRTLVDIETEGALQESILRYNALDGVREIRNAQARIGYEADVAIATIMNDSNINQALTRGRAGLQAAGIMAQAAHDSAFMEFTGNTQANQIRNAGMHTSSQFSQQATNSLVDGLFTLGSVAGKAYDKGMFKSPAPTKSAAVNKASWPSSYGTLLA